ncbi:hypothetical protein [Xylophilus sp.]|uniref:hypothetical protein n=1 Tax=Xylophilus sp. TaxID=2653893 RepID=UPI0013B80F3F|nr:hypothetical protein [Xylophilus sp.]KAF1045525.1 MAG: hypothetical protein GAK38_02974 [Xylophilus sp.]
MHVLRTSSSRLARLVLAWFVLALGVAVASPVVHPQSMELVCTAGAGVRMVASGDDGRAIDAGRHTLDCPLCLGAAPPPAPQLPRAELPQPLARARLPAAQVHVAGTAGAPLPPRGPPALS